MKSFVKLAFVLLVVGCSSRTTVIDEEAPEPTELELLCSDWCDTQRTCGFSGDYEPEGDCAPNCVSSRGWNDAWETGCQEETREVLACLGDSTCADLAPMFDLMLGGPPPCAEQLSDVLFCSSS